MRLSLRFIIPLLLALGLFAYAVVPLVDKLTLDWFVRDLDSRASLVTNTVQGPLLDLIRTDSWGKVLDFFTKITEDERLYAIAFCPAGKGEPVATAMLPSAITCDNLETFERPSGYLLRTEDGPLLVSVRTLDGNGESAGALVFVHDMSFIERRSEETRKYLFLFFVGLGVVVSLITVVIAQLSWRGWVQGLRALVRGEGVWRAAEGTERAELRPIARDLRELIRDLRSESGSHDDEDAPWTPETLRGILRGELRGDEILVVSNREPYIHVRGRDGITVSRPASGLVTAVEPIVRACSGTWIAHGSGSADRDVVDRNDRISVPPEHPAYALRRV